MTENNKIEAGNFYTKLTPNERQACDLCRDWGMGGCEKCNIASQYILKQEVKAMDIVLYTIGCKNCDILEKKLKAKNIKFLRVSDEDTIRAKGFGDSFFPILEVCGEKMSYRTAIQWINNQ